MGGGRRRGVGGEKIGVQRNFELALFKERGKN